MLNNLFGRSKLFPVDRPSRSHQAFGGQRTGRRIAQHQAILGHARLQVVGCDRICPGSSALIKDLALGKLGNQFLQYLVALGRVFLYVVRLAQDQDAPIGLTPAGAAARDASKATARPRQKFLFR